MSNFNINIHGYNIWYDIKSDLRPYGDGLAWSHYIDAANGKNFYFRLHRENNCPAFIGLDGTEMYSIKGKRHREDGPAYIPSDRKIIFWYLNNIQYLFYDWCEELNKSEEEINYLRLEWNLV